MYTDLTINPIQPAYHDRKTFHDVFQQMLNNQSKSRPPKVEVKGLLVPCDERAGDLLFKFKLETPKSEYLLDMSDFCFVFAKKMEWENVVVYGYLDAENNVIDVEKIRLIQQYAS